MKYISVIMAMGLIGTGCDALQKLEDLQKIKYTVTGSVTDADTGKALLGVSIQVADQRDLTDPDGHFAINVSAMGEHDLHFDLKGYKPYSVRATVDRSQIDLKIALTKSDVDYTPHQFFGYIIDEATGRSIDHARVTIRDEVFEADDVGKFKFKDAIQVDTYRDQDIKLTNSCLEFSRLAFFAYPNYSYLAVYVKVTAEGTEVFGDLNADRIVDINDVDIFIQSMNTIRGNPLFSEKADLNKDGVVDLKDYTILRSNFGKVLIGAECREQ